MPVWVTFFTVWVTCRPCVRSCSCHGRYSAQKGRDPPSGGPQPGLLREVCPSSDTWASDQAYACRCAQCPAGAQASDDMEITDLLERQELRGMGAEEPATPSA